MRIVSISSGKGASYQIAKCEERNKPTTKILTCFPKTKAVVIGYRSFKPSNAILLALIPWCPIIAVRLLENCFIFSMFSGGLISIFFQISRIFLIILRCSWGNISENVYVKIDNTDWKILKRVRFLSDNSFKTSNFSVPINFESGNDIGQIL